MTGLIKRLEEAEGPDRELSNAIYAELNPLLKPVGGEASSNRFYNPNKISRRAAEKYIVSGGATSYAPHYTSSIDSALTLVPDGWGFGIFPECTQLTYGPIPALKVILAKAKTPALAICIASLKALQEQDT